MYCYMFYRCPLGALALKIFDKVLFPDADDAYQGADSKACKNMFMGWRKQRLYVWQRDMTVICELPKLSPHNQAT